MSYRAKRKSKSRSPKRGRPKGGRPKGVKGDRLKMTVNELVKQGEQDMERFRSIRKSLLTDARSLDRKFLIQKKVLMSMNERQDRINLKFSELQSEIKESKDELISVLNKMIKKGSTIPLDVKKDKLVSDSFPYDSTLAANLDIQDDITDDLLANRKLLARSPGLKQILQKVKTKAQQIEKRREMREDRVAGREDESIMLSDIQSDYNLFKGEMISSLRSRLFNYLRKIVIQEEQIDAAMGNVNKKGKTTVKDAIAVIIKLLDRTETNSIFVSSSIQTKVKTPLETLKSALSEQNKALRGLRSKFTGKSFDAYDF